MTSHVETYLWETAAIADSLKWANNIEDMAVALKAIKGRVYCIGLGGSLANCIHMAADFRKLCGIDAVAPNLAEMSAYINDEGPASALHGFLGTIRVKTDALFVLSVGGGTNDVSPAITIGVQMAHSFGIPIFGIVGPNGGETAKLGTHVIKIPAPADRVTPHTEAFQAVVWHCLVSHPLLQIRSTKW